MQSSTLENFNDIAALSEAASLLTRFLEGIKCSVRSSVRAVEDDDHSQVEAQLSNLADQLSRMVSVFNLLYRDSKAVANGEQTGDHQLKQVQIHLLSVLKAIKSAQHSGDKPMLIDLLEYELQDNLTQWKIKAIPKLKNMIQSAQMG